jgi:predicted adenine nucleotide alpha hydrolase (AANH) superfamily ATPase
MAEPTLLVHACCAQCLAAILDPLRRFDRWAAYFYNPNIHPLLEFRRRAKSLHVLAEREQLALMVDERYDVRGFLRTVPWDRPERCLACYRMRLDETARVAAEKGFSAMTTTLLASEHQDHEAVRRLGEEAAAGRGLGFHYEDWRALAGRGREEAKRRSLYRQQYCGCLFSEEERFAPTSLHLYRGSKTAEQSREGET